MDNNEQPIDAVVTTTSKNVVQIDGKRITLARTQDYIRNMLTMPRAEAVDFMNDQTKAVMIAINEQVLRWLEVLNSDTANVVLREEATTHISMLVAAVAKLNEMRISLDKVVNPSTIGQPRKLYDTKAAGGGLTPEGFMAKYGHLAPGGTK